MAIQEIQFISYFRSLYPEIMEMIPDLDPGEVSSPLLSDGCPWDTLPPFPRAVDEKIRIISKFFHSVLHRPLDSPIAIILAGGRGSRMGNDTAQKSLSPIQGKPAILHTIETCRSHGIENFVIVSGVGYRETIECVAPHCPQAVFVYQETPLGTGHAARVASRYLQWIGYSGDAIVIMGDKYISPRGFERLILDHKSNLADVTIASASKSAWPDSGRIVFNSNGHVIAIIEKPDLIQRQLYYDFIHWQSNPVSARQFYRHACHLWNRPDKLKKIMGDPFWDMLQQNTDIDKNHSAVRFQEADCYFSISETDRLSSREIEARCDQVNISVYYFTAAALYDSMERLRAENAQHELYLTDAVKILAQSSRAQTVYTVRASKMPDDYDIMGFNTAAELDRIESKLSNRP